MWTVEVYPRRGFDPGVAIKLSLRQEDGPYGVYWKGDIPEGEEKRAKRMIHRAHASQRWYKKEWGRSSDYRKVFFKENPPPYRCRYCGRPLKKNQVQVDHLVPVAAAKKSLKARDLLYIHRMRSVNDSGNLVPSCRKCNQKKGTKMGLWYIRGRLGKYHLYWVIVRICRVAVFFLAAYVMFCCLGNYF